MHRYIDSAASAPPREDGEELSASRATLEHEQREARRLRVESEATRAEYARKLERLQARRDDLYRSMRDDLDRAFGEAHARIAGVVRELQRGVSSQDAARAREELLELEATAREAEAEAGLETRSAPARAPLDWSRARPGDPVLLRRVIDNLLQNAAKYSDAPHPIVLRARSEPGATTCTEAVLGAKPPRKSTSTDVA